MDNTVARGTINRNEPDGAFAQVNTVGGRPRPETEVLQGQGVHFKAPDGSDCLVLSPVGDPGNAVAVVAGKRTALPIAPLLQEGEGGLHYLGEYKVFLAANGKVYLGASTPLVPVDAVALASKVQEMLLQLKDAFDNHTHAVSGGTAAIPTPSPALISVASEDVFST